MKIRLMIAAAVLLLLLGAQGCSKPQAADSGKPDAANHFEQGLALYQEGKLEEAIGEYDKALEIKPDYGEVYFAKGNAHRELADYDQAIADFDKAIGLEPKSALAYLGRGLSLSEGLGRFVIALTDFDKAIELAPNMADAYAYRGYALTILGEHEEATGDLQKSISLSSDSRGVRSAVITSLELILIDEDDPENKRQIEGMIKKLGQQ